jgi:hypothetical protein
MLWSVPSKKNPSDVSTKVVDSDEDAKPVEQTERLVKTDAKGLPTAERVDAIARVGRFG